MYAGYTSVTSRVYTASKQVTGGDLNMRRKIAIGTLGLMVLLAAAISVGVRKAPPKGPGLGKASIRSGGGGSSINGATARSRFAGGGRGQFGRQRRAGGPGGHGMGWQRGGRRGFGGGEGLLRMAENPRVRQYLGLTDEQVGRLHKIGVMRRKLPCRLAPICNCATLNSVNCCGRIILITTRSCRKLMR